MNEELAMRVLSELLLKGVKEICLCPGGRNAPFCFLLRQNEHIKTYYWHEERSASFFAIGRSRATNAPVAVIVTSGTAAGELLPAAMEAYYSGVPLILVTADRPRRFRNTGAPQTAEQLSLFGQYALFELDLEGNEPCCIDQWSQRGVCHINVCFEEPKSADQRFTLNVQPARKKQVFSFSRKGFEAFIQSVDRPLVLLSTIKEEAKEPIINFLCALGAPTYIEGISLLREEPRLQHLRIYNPDLELFDSVLRIGGIPTHRAWRDLEMLMLPVFSITEFPFKGLSYGEIEQAEYVAFFENYLPVKQFEISQDLIEKNKQFCSDLKSLILEEPFAEPSLVNSLSELIPTEAHIYLGNSMPIRNWDLAATNSHKKFYITATRGLNGIDGQLSCFLGLAQTNRENWALLGDLTALYDLSAPWILPQLEAEQIKIVVLNNYGGRIFARKFKEIEIQNRHELQFEHFAKLWNLSYERWHQVPNKAGLAERALIELNSDIEATERFWKRYTEIKQTTCAYFQ